MALCIPRNVRLSEAPGFGLPAVLYDPSCAEAKAYLEFADEIIRGGTLTFRFRSAEELQKLLGDFQLNHRSRRDSLDSHRRN
jgi:hypothetical protein